MTQDVADKSVNLDHVMQVNDLLQRVLKGSVSSEQMDAIALAIGSGQNPTTTALARMIKVAYSRDPKAIRQFLAEQVTLYEIAQSFVRHVINGDADPFVPEDWKKIEHKRCGQVEWDTQKFSDTRLLHLDERQIGSGSIGGSELRKVLEVLPVLNASILDWLLRHPDQIPSSFKNKLVFFWGTIYAASDGDLCVRHLFWDGEQWCDDFYWLDDIWTHEHPAIMGSILD